MPILFLAQRTLWAEVNPHSEFLNCLLGSFCAWKMSSLLGLVDGMLLPCLLAVAGAFACYVLWAQTYWTRRGVPQTRPRILIGDMFDSLLMRRTVGSILGDIYRRFEGKPFVGIYQLTSPVLLVRDADLVQEVLVQNFTSFQNNATTLPAGKEEVLSDNPFVADAERWKELRTRLSLLFTPVRVRQSLADMAESSRRLADFLEATGPSTSLEGTNLAKRFTAHASSRVMFGIESHSLEVGSEPGVFYDMGHNIFNNGLMTTLRFVSFLNFPSFLNVLGHKMISNEIIQFFRKLIRDSVEYRSKENISRDDFLQYVAKQVMVNGKIDDAALQKSTAQAINTYVETFETSALVIATTLLMLATHPSVQDKAREELRAKVPPGQPLQEDTVASLTYLEQVIKETLRFFPAADTLRRQCTKATTLRDPSDSSRAVSLRPGDLVYVPVDAIHHDAAHYSHPDEFRPEHFSEEEAESRPKCAFMGFGDGPRHCPGMRFAMQEMKVVLATLLLRLQVEPGPEQVLPPKRDATSPILGIQGGIWLRFRPLP